MLEEIGSLERIPWAVARAKDKKDAFRLMGFGHRVYKSFDPRARVMRRVAHEVLEHLNIRCASLLSFQSCLTRLALPCPLDAGNEQVRQR